ncbi:thiopeptide-type bacteriocin biosynthesis protein [Streptomyces sp. NPDC087440]|uniref:thiopeptide-type bacteriocin biosynthesis protein n=1 Tax=Streptomyces sp. NPDC087440 TaxID=3365790 RepID=UPI0037F57692
MNWHQTNLAFPQWAHAEDTALAHLAPLLCKAEDDGTIAEWFIVRKHPCWRVRFLAPEFPATTAAGLDALNAAGHLNGWVRVVYEPEVRAFGGTAAMDVAHRLFHHDSRHLLTHLQRIGKHRRETSLLLCSLLMRSAGLDWYEQGDVWARVSEHREEPPALDAAQATVLHQAVLRLLTVDSQTQIQAGTGPLAGAAPWAQAYTSAGQDLAHLNATGGLRRGLRDVLAHHVIFAWNRAGLPHLTQAALAAAATTVTLGPDPTTGPAPTPSPTIR